MNYLIEGLDPALFAPLFARNDAELAAEQILAVTATDNDYPCRISLAGAAQGDRLLLVNYTHQPARNAYHSAHAIYVAQGSLSKGVYHNSIPPVMLTRILSVRAFDHDDMIVDADVVDGRQVEPLIQRFLADQRVAYLHVHFAKRGCFAAKVLRS